MDNACLIPSDVLAPVIIALVPIGICALSACIMACRNSGRIRHMDYRLRGIIYRPPAAVPVALPMALNQRQDFYVEIQDPI